jgi:hypothetical protein
MTSIDDMLAALAAAAASGTIQSLRLGKVEYELYFQARFIERRTKPPEQHLTTVSVPTLTADDSHFEVGY